MTDERDERLDALARKLGRCVEGEYLLDIASVCARLIGFALCEAFDDEQCRTETLDQLIDFMRLHIDGEGYEKHHKARGGVH